MSDDKQLTSDEVKTKVIEEYGFDEDTQSEQIDKAVKKELDNQIKLSKAIDKKSEYRKQLVEAGLIDPKTFKPIVKESKKETDKTDEIKINQEDLSAFMKYHTRTELQFLKRVMKAEECDFDTAWKSDLFKGMKDANDAKIQKKSAKLGTAGSSSGRSDNTPQPSNESEKAFSEYMQQRANRNSQSYGSNKKTNDKS